jgi:hypothetical protein
LGKIKKLFLVPVPIRGRHLLNLAPAMGIIEKVIADEIIQRTLKKVPF